jgi:hypothetical protein
MKKIVALLVGFLTFFLVPIQIQNRFLKTLSETLLTPDGSQVAFQDILKETRRKNGGP